MKIAQTFAPAIAADSSRVALARGTMSGKRDEAPKKIKE